MRSCLVLPFVCSAVLLLAIQVRCRPQDEVEDPEDVLYPGDEDYEEDREEVYTGPPPIIRTRSQNISANIGDTVHLPCLVEHTSQFVVMWRNGTRGLYMDKMAQTEDPRVSKLPNNTIVIKDVQATDSQHYSCQVIASPKLEIVHTLNVYSPPKVVRLVPDGPVKILRKGTPLTLMCEAMGFPTPVISWTRKGKHMPSGEEELIGTAITIDSVTRKHAGVYECRATNKEASDAASVEIHVHYEPEIDIEKEAVNSGEGYESELVCSVHAEPKAKVTWLKDGRPVTPSHHVSIDKDGSKHILRISATKVLDFGQYICQANNSLGQTSKAIFLSGKPTRPRFDSAGVAEDNKSPVLTWNLESHAPITEYELIYKKQQSDEWKTESPIVTNSVGIMFTVKHTLSALAPGVYQAQLRAKNQYGWSELSESHSFSGDIHEGDGDSQAGLLESSQKESEAPELRISAALLLSLLFAHYYC